MAPTDSIDLHDVERLLLERRERLRGRITEFAKPPERGAIGFGKRIGDGTVEAISRRDEIGLGGSLEVSEDRVSRALAKLTEGTYGICDSCGEPIAPARLKAAPESVLCIACARLAH